MLFINKRVFKKLGLGFASLLLLAPLMATTVNASVQPQAVPANTNRMGQKPVSNNQKSVQQQIRKIMMKQANAQRAKALKNSQPSFIIKGNEVYTVRVMAIKNGSAQMIPNTMKRYMSVKRFSRVARKELLRASFMYRRALKIRNKIARNRQIREAYQLYTEYRRVGRIQVNKTSQSNKTKKINNRKRNQGQNKRTIRKSHQKINRRRRNKKRKRHAKRSRRFTKRNRRRPVRSFTVKEGNQSVTYLNSLYRRGNKRTARRSGFSNGLTSGNLHVMFNRYRPNDHRAVIPHNYRIYKVNLKHVRGPVTAWVVGRHTNSMKKINHARQAYYYCYNKKYGGWSDVGYQNNK